MSWFISFISRWTRWDPEAAPLSSRRNESLVWRLLRVLVPTRSREGPRSLGVEGDGRLFTLRRLPLPPGPCGRHWGQPVVQGLARFSLRQRSVAPRCRGAGGEGVQLCICERSMFLNYAKKSYNLKEYCPSWRNSSFSLLLLLPLFTVEAGIYSIFYSYYYIEGFLVSLSHFTFLTLN